MRWDDVNEGSAAWDTSWIPTANWRNRATRQEAATFEAHGNWVVDLAFAPDGRTLATCGGDKKVRLWRAPTLSETDRDGQPVAHR